MVAGKLLLRAATTRRAPEGRMCSQAPLGDCCQEALVPFHVSFAQLTSPRVSDLTETEREAEREESSPA